MAVVYVETTIPSFYYEERPDPASVARRELTRAWWPVAHRAFELVTSAAVIAELERTPEPKRSLMLQLVEPLPILTRTERVAEVAEVYVARQVMPRDPLGDALHLAFASVYGCDYLVTWNCRHLANAAKFHHIRVVNSLLGLAIPTLSTPEQLMEASDETGSGH